MGIEGKDKFKVGDRVRLLRDGLSTTGAAGHTAIVMGLEMNGKGEGGADILVTIEDGQKPFKSVAVGGMDTRVDADGIELVSSGTPAIVAVIENGTPKPNKAPKIHATEADATKEAERLASRNPGEKFGVFVMTTARIADVTVRVV